MDEKADLQLLRDIHLPDHVAWWPPAPGWLALAALSLCATVAVCLLLRRHRAARLVRESQRELTRLRAQFDSSGDSARLVADLSRLLRRVALSRCPRESVAGLTGQRWLHTLDRIGQVEGFVSGPGRVLAEAPYQPQVEVDCPELLALCERWLRAAARTP